MATLHGDRVREGFLKKFPPIDKARRRRDLKKRYIILWESCHVSYYTDEDVGNCRGVINLTECASVEPFFTHSLVNQNETAFALRCKDRTFAFVLNNVDEMQKWAAEIERMRKIAHGEPDLLRRHSMHIEKLYASVKRKKDRVNGTADRPLPAIPPSVSPFKAAATMSVASRPPPLSLPHRPTSSPGGMPRMFSPTKAASLPRSMASLGSGSFDDADFFQTKQPVTRTIRKWHSFAEPGPRMPLVDASPYAGMSKTPTESRPYTDILENTGDESSYTDMSGRNASGQSHPYTNIGDTVEGSYTDMREERPYTDMSGGVAGGGPYTDMSGQIKGKEEDPYMDMSGQYRRGEEDPYTDMSGVLSMRSMRSELLIQPLTSGQKAIGIKGGLVNAGSAELFVSPGAIKETEAFSLSVYLDSNFTPSVLPASNKLILSPVIFVEPHGRQLNGNVYLRLPHCARSLNGWSLQVMRCDSDQNEFPSQWSVYATYPPQNGQPESRSVDSEGLIKLNHFCWLCIQGEAEVNADPELNVRVAIYGRRVVSDGSYWLVHVLFFLDCGDENSKLRVRKTDNDPDLELWDSITVPLPIGAEIVLNISDPNDLWRSTRPGASHRRIPGAKFWESSFDQEVPHKFDFKWNGRQNIANVDEFTCRCEVQVKLDGSEDDDEPDFSAILQVREPLVSTQEEEGLTPPASPPQVPDEVHTIVDV
eukprot:m.256913 g.256913  ORF g.256913 m.256913 type:complete len:705 (+) comp40404_c0_seq48:61-2175(+)